MREHDKYHGLVVQIEKELYTRLQLAKIYINEPMQSIAKRAIIKELVIIEKENNINHDNIYKQKTNEVQK